MYVLMVSLSNHEVPALSFSVIPGRVQREPGIHLSLRYQARIVPRRTWIPDMA
jgi:hypothetical protein